MSSPTDHLDDRVLSVALRHVAQERPASRVCVPQANRWLSSQPPCLGSAALLTEYDAGKLIPRAQLLEFLGHDLLILKSLEGVQRRFRELVDSWGDLEPLDRWLDSFTSSVVSPGLLSVLLLPQLRHDPKTRDQVDQWELEVHDFVRRLPLPESWSLLGLVGNGSKSVDYRSLLLAIDNDLALFSLVRGTLWYLLQHVRTTSAPGPAAAAVAATSPATAGPTAGHLVD